MAVVVSNGATTLATASGFYAAEAYNLGMYSATYLALSSTRTIPVTFANAGNCQGVILDVSSGSATTTRSITVVLQENVASVWTDRSSVTLTANQIANSAANTSYAQWIVPFNLTPYAVTTAGSTWRFSISQTGSGTNWSLKTSNGTNPFYVTWCDNAATFASNDVVVAKDKVTIDQTATFKGITGTGSATHSTCAIACRSTTPTPANVAMFEWENAPAAAYTLTIDGFFVLSAHSGFRAGTSASPIPTAQMATIDVISATSGTSTNSGFNDGSSTSDGVVGRMNLFLYGEVPATRVTTLANTANTGQQDIVTTDSTGWAVNDSICITKGNGNSSTAETVPFTIDTIAGTAINVNTNIVTYNRMAGGHVFRMNGYGIYLMVNFNLATNTKLWGVNGLVLSGVRLSGVNIGTSNGTVLWNDDSANITSQLTVQYCSMFNNSFASASALFSAISHVAGGTFLIDGCHAFRQGTVGTQYGPTGLKTIRNSIFFDCSGPLSGSFNNDNYLYEDNYLYNSLSNAIATGGMVNSTIQRNYFYGNTYSLRADGPIINMDWNNNITNVAVSVIFTLKVLVNFIMVDDTIGDEGLVTYLFNPLAGSSVYSETIMRDPTIGTVGATTVFNPGVMVDGAYFNIQNYDNLAGDDRSYMPYGEIWRTGATLADTTVRTAGGSAMRFMPIHATSEMHWEQTIPTGDISTKTMTITCWVYINNAAYYAGTHTKPTLTVTYDQTSTVTAVATATAGSWQQLACTFTPTTSFGQIEMEITGATDATGTNRYFYVDDFNIAYPAGVQIDLGGLDLWADGLPVAPAIATMPSITGVWDEPLTAHTVSGSFGAFIKKLLTVGKFLGLK